jgi:hypothetical protein
MIVPFGDDESSVKIAVGELVPMPSRPSALSQKRPLEVASAEAPLPKRMEPLLMFDQPVPPLPALSAEASVRTPALLNDEVPVVPK